MVSAISLYPPLMQSCLVTVKELSATVLFLLASVLRTTPDCDFRVKKNLEATMKYYDTKFKMNYFEFIDSIKKIII